MSNQIPKDDEEFFDEAIWPKCLFGELKTSIFIPSFITPIGNKEACSVVSFQEKEKESGSASVEGVKRALKNRSASNLITARSDNKFPFWPLIQCIWFLIEVEATTEWMNVKFFSLLEPLDSGLLLIILFFNSHLLKKVDVSISFLLQVANVCRVDRKKPLNVRNVVSGCFQLCLKMAKYVKVPPLQSRHDCLSFLNRMNWGLPIIGDDHASWKTTLMDSVVSHKEKFEWLGPLGWAFTSLKTRGVWSEVLGSRQWMYPRRNWSIQILLQRAQSNFL